MSLSKIVFAAAILICALVPAGAASAQTDAGTLATPGSADVTTTTTFADDASSGGATENESANPGQESTNSSAGFRIAVITVSVLVVVALIIGVIRKRDPESWLNSNNQREGH